MPKFKVENEGGLYDIYETKKAGKTTIIRGNLSLRCTLSAIDVPAAEASAVPSFLEIASDMRRAA